MGFFFILVKRLKIIQKEQKETLFSHKKIMIDIKAMDIISIQV